MEISRRGLFWMVCGFGGSVLFGLAWGKQRAWEGKEALNESGERLSETRFDYMCRRLQGKVGKDIYDCWFLSLDFERYVGGVLTVSVPVSFLKHWLSTHYMHELEAAAAQAFMGVWKVEVVQREPRFYPRVAQRDVIHRRA